MNQQSDKDRTKDRNIRSLLIEPFKQIKFGIYMIAISFVFLSISSVLFVNSFIEQYAHVMEIFQIINPDKQWDMVLNDVFYKNALRLVLFFIAYFCVIFYIVFKLTHRYYGPLISIQRFLDRLIKGEYDSRVSIRSKDELQDLVAKLNTLAETLQNRHKKD